MVGLAGESGRSSLVADTLQLEVAVDTGRALYAWGYLPSSSWKRAALQLPDSRPGEVIVQLDASPLEDAVSVSIARSKWDVLFDEQTGLVRVSRDQRSPEELIEIATGVHLGLVGADLNSFWLQPEFVQ
ncbi:hypothetical protein OU415_14590 [Saccharopolyspora sp. WRP15-2]|uniref:Uncharacterized protein n=1 Tax=Saccharopolyspora oryzae TaxID=2997343 RepID=A0ABT4UZP8_9PSEU|nr:hypothetical protein [Saccharopolyspora oryzae]MDA3626671.1 hypothetical protein [Saccharopolyspora oryzae]